jgi:hypothetical protein
MVPGALEGVWPGGRHLRTSGEDLRLTRPHGRVPHQEPWCTYTKGVQTTSAGLKSSQRKGMYLQRPSYNTRTPNHVYTKPS